jgi:prevent-host-death family protein
MAYHTKKVKEVQMTILSATEARSNLYRLIDQTSSSHEPIIITGKRGNAVLLSEEDWKSIQETLFLLSIPGMRDSIREGLAAPVDDCQEELDW